MHAGHGETSAINWWTSFSSDWCRSFAAGQILCTWRIPDTEKMEWFKNVLELPNGIPDSDTFRRVFERIDPQGLATVLQDVVAVEGKTVALDGKTICGSGNEQHRAYHVVSAWVTESQITLGQLCDGGKVQRDHGRTRTAGHTGRERKHCHCGCHELSTGNCCPNKARRS